MITSNNGVWEWAKDSAIDNAALNSRIQECFFLKPVFDVQPEDAATVEKYKTAYAIPLDEPNWCFVTRGYNYNGRAGGAALERLFRRYFELKKWAELTPLKPGELIQNLKWELPLKYRTPTFSKL